MSDPDDAVLLSPLELLVVLDDLPRQCGYRRIDRRLSLRDAAAEMGVPLATLHRFEQRRGDPRLSVVMKVARWLSIVSPIQMIAGARVD